MVRGDHRVNDIKLRNALGTGFRPAQEGEFADRIGPGGYIGPVGADAPILLDDAVAPGAYVTGANRDGYHLRGVEPGRDFPFRRADMRRVEEGDTVNGSPIRIEPAIEIGNIFKLGISNSGTFASRSRFSHTVSSSAISRREKSNRSSSGATPRGRLESPRPQWKTSFCDGAVADLAGQLQQYNVRFSRNVQNTFFTTLLSWVLPNAIFFGISVLWFRHIAKKQGLGGGLMSIGRSKAKVYVETDIKTSFDDVAGVDEAKEELAEIVQFLRDPEANTAGSARASRKACCWWGRRAPARHCWRVRLQVKPEVASFPSMDRNLSRCSSAGKPRASAICSSRPTRRHRRSSSSTNWMRWGGREAPIPMAATTRKSRP